MLEPTTAFEISEICASAGTCTGTSAGFDQVTMDVVKETIDLIIDSLTHIMNLSLSSGIVHEQMKVARVILYFNQVFLPFLQITSLSRSYLLFLSF